MPIDKVKKFKNRMVRLGKYKTVLLKAKFPMSLNNYLLSAIERGEYLEWIGNKIIKLTRDYAIFHGHENSKRYFKMYYKFITNVIISLGEKFEESLEKEKILDEKRICRKD